MGLYQKHRPSSLDTVVGNNDTVEALEKLLGKKDIPHAFLLCGPTGCGKTTIARILSERVGAAMGDITEVDSADFRGIDTIRDLRKQASFVPLHGDSRVFILDECHQLSKDAQNALLKQLEDTPSHVYFILCTTEPHKLLPTIRSRCSTHDVNPLSETEMVKLLKRIIKSENRGKEKKKVVDDKVLEAIAESSLGHPRGAINILEKVLVVSKDKQMKVAKQAAEEQTQSIELAKALLRRATWKEVSFILKGLKDEDPERIRRHILGYCNAVLLNGSNDIAAAIMEEMIEPFYNSGMPGLVFACYAISK